MFAVIARASLTAHRDPDRDNTTDDTESTRPLVPVRRRPRLISLVSHRLSAIPPTSVEIIAFRFVRDLHTYAFHSGRVSPILLFTVRITRRTTSVARGTNVSEISNGVQKATDIGTNGRLHVRKRVWKFTFLFFQTEIIITVRAASIQSIYSYLIRLCHHHQSCRWVPSFIRLPF